MLTKILASFAVLGAAAGIAGLGTYATFTSSTSANGALKSGAVSIGLGGAGGANRLTVGASGLLPGDTIQRVVDLNNTSGAGSDNLGAISLTTTASPSSLLDTDTASGLQMKVENCPAAWVEGGTAPAYTYSCTGAVTTVIAPRPVIGTDVDLGALGALTTGGSDHLRVTLSLPATAPNTMQSLNSSIDYAFNAVQRASGAK
jgi:hypothetical protein